MLGQRLTFFTIACTNGQCRLSFLRGRRPDNRKAQLYLGLPLYDAVVRGSGATRNTSVPKAVWRLVRQYGSHNIRIKKHQFTRVDKRLPRALECICERLLSGVPLFQYLAHFATFGHSRFDGRMVDRES